MKKNWKVIIGLILALIVVIFACMNMETATINFGFTQLDQPLIILIISATLIGAIIVALFSSTTIFSKNREIKSLKKEIEQLKENQQQIVDQTVQQEKELLTKQNTIAKETEENSSVNE